MKWIIAAIVCLVILIAACFILLGDNEKEYEKVDDKEQIMLKALKFSKKDQKTVDTTKVRANTINCNDSARNK